MSANSASLERHLPTSGELLGFLTEHLGLREAVGTDSTVQRIFRGERVKPESVRELVTHLVDGLWTADLADAVGASREAAESHNQATVQFLMQTMEEWDARRARLYVDLRPGDTALAFFPFLRLAALDLGLRVGAYAWMKEEPQPSREPLPRWMHECGVGRTLDEMTGWTKTLKSRAQLAEKAYVSANAMSAWCTEQSFPSNENIERLAIELADDADGIEKAQVEYRLRVALLLCWTRKALCEALGNETATDLIQGTLWVANRVWDFARLINCDRLDPNLIELLWSGARSFRGQETARLLADETPNRLLRMDLAALPFDWRPRLRWWLPLMLQAGQPLVAQMRRFFPEKEVDQASIEEALRNASTPTALSVLAYVEMNLGRWGHAAELWGKAARLEPANATHHYNAGMALYRALGETPEAVAQALAECRIAAALDENFHEAHIEVAGFLVDLGRFDEALAIYAETKARGCDSVRLEFDWGHALMSLGRAPEAAEHFKSATDLEPRYVDAWANLCFVLERAGKKREAREAAKRAEFLGYPLARMSLDGELDVASGRGR